jgi:hypothetical protein
MAVKTAYKTPAPRVQIDDEKIQPSESVHIDFGTDKAEPSVAIVSADEFPLDEATLALQKQLAHLKQSEELQRNHARYAAQQQMAAPAPTLPAEPEARIALWRQHGLTDDDASFLQANPELAAEPGLTRLASDEAALHHERDTDAHRAATLEAFHRLQGQQAQTRTATDPAGFFEPPEPARSPAAPDRAALYSAPVSRTASPGSYREPSPRSVKLSPAEQQIAAAMESQTSNMQRTKCGCSENVPPGNETNGLLRARAAAPIR